jgi:hypothetical protein
VFKVAKLSEFSFYSVSTIDEDSSVTNFVAKGYVDNREDHIIWYYKNENEYKMIIRESQLEVYVNDSHYIFDKNKKTEALIKIDNYLYFNFKMKKMQEKLGIC